MSNIEFVWDPAKAGGNFRKHGISFSEAQSVFYDENARQILDSQHSKAEDRFVLLGMSGNLRVLVVCHCYRERECMVRIISARKATASERLSYSRAL